MKKTTETNLVNRKKTHTKPLQTKLSIVFTLNKALENITASLWLS